MVLKSGFVSVALALITCATPGVGAAAGTAPAPLEAARKTFATAVAAHDIGRIIELSRFPLAVEMTGFPHTLPAKRLRMDKTAFTDLFGTPDPQTVQCLAASPLALQNDRTQFGYASWYADCNGNEYFFSLAGGSWRFTGYQNINE